MVFLRLCVFSFAPLREINFNSSGHNRITHTINYSR